MSSTVASTGGDNRYKGVQRKLKAYTRALDATSNDLEQLQRRMRGRAARAEGVAQDVAHADLDRQFVYLTSQVSVALGGAAVELRKLVTTAADSAARAEAARRRHARLYGALDELRSSRRHRTPKPGFFTD